MDSQYLEDPDVTGQFLRDLVPDEQLTVAALVGDPVPVSVEQRTINGASQLALAHSCSYDSPTGPQVANPAVRTAALVESFGSRGVHASICQLDFAVQLAATTLAIKRSLGIACIDTAQLADSLADPGVQPACEARDVHADGTATTLPRCPSTGTCFDIVPDPVACAETTDHARVIVTRTQPPAADTRVEVSCEAPLPMPPVAVDAGR
ncbi:MAG: hypothetical protein M3680_21140 [Myxococcota bacterium]|nr:hypothetical protein [Myxococcota bacterium]